MNAVNGGSLNTGLLVAYTTQTREADIQTTIWLSPKLAVIKVHSARYRSQTSSDPVAFILLDE